MSKQVNILYIFSTMLLSLLAGCEQEASLTPLPDNGEQEPVEILLSARVAGVSTVVTRAGTDFQESLVGATIGLYGAKGKQTQEVLGEEESFCDSIYMSNHSLEYDNSNGSLTSSTAKIYFPAGREKAFLYAYCPYTAGAGILSWPKSPTTDLCIRVKSGMSNQGGEWTDAPVDPLHDTATATIERKGPADSGATQPGTAHFDLTHRMAQLQILVMTDDEKEKYTLQAITVKFRTSLHGYMNLRTGDIIPAQVQPETYIETLGEGIPLSTAPASEQTSQFIHSALPGRNVITAIELTVKMGDATEAANYTVYEAGEANPSIDLESNKKTRVLINFHPKSSASASLDDWSSSEEYPIDYNK